MTTTTHPALEPGRVLVGNAASHIGDNTMREKLSSPFGVVFASGTNRPADIIGTFAAGRHVGIEITQIKSASAGEKNIIEAGQLPEAMLFVDSGAFSELGGPSITDAMWIERLTRYAHLAPHWGPRGFFVAPDCVGNQQETLRRMRVFRPHIQDLISSFDASVILPLQLGALTISEFFEEVIKIFGYSPNHVWGMPSKKSATTAVHVAQFARHLARINYPTPRIHFLGSAPARPPVQCATGCISGQILCSETLSPARDHLQ